MLLPNNIQIASYQLSLYRITLTNKSHFIGHPPKLHNKMNVIGQLLKFNINNLQQTLVIGQSPKLNNNKPICYWAIAYKQLLANYPNSTIK